MNDENLKVQFQEAITRRDLGDAAGALEILMELAKRYPARASVWGTLGGIYFSQDDWPNAVAAFLHATSLAPRSELSSVSLFNSLLRLGRESEASAEASRFLREVPDSLEYRRLQRELSEKGFSMLHLPGA